MYLNNVKTISEIIKNTMLANGVYLLNPLLCMNKKYFENVHRIKINIINILSSR